PTPTSTPTLCASTAGYWGSHPDAWCVQTIQIGCQVYTKAQAIAFILNSTSGDKTYSLAAQLIAAKLNVNCAGTDSSCVASAISSADAWLCQHPVGSNVDSHSPEWKEMTSTRQTLSHYIEAHLFSRKCKT